MNDKKKYRVLVFPCGSEIGLEIYRSLQYSAHFEVVGASSVDDHGKFVYPNYIGNVPFIDSEDFVPKLNQIISDSRIDFIYPTMDKVIRELKRQEEQLSCEVIASPLETTEICLSKTRTYQKLGSLIKVPKRYPGLDSIDRFPVFIKPDVGYGSRNVFLARNVQEVQAFFNNKSNDDYLILEYLEGKEYTVDCFTDGKGRLRFVGPRERVRIRNGISVNTRPVRENRSEFVKMAEVINNELTFNGSWFFQVKRDAQGTLTLLEVAARLGGSSALYRGKGINFALLSLYVHLGMDVELIENEYEIELDRALENRYQIDYAYDTVYVDFDDCLIIDGKINTQMVKFLYDAINREKKIILLTKHIHDIEDSLARYRLKPLFDEIIQINHGTSKADYINPNRSIFIDDSFSERLDVRNKLGIPVFSPDMIEVLEG